MKLSERPIGYVVLGAVFVLTLTMLYGNEGQRLFHTGIVFLLLLYGLPAIVAISRRHHQTLAISVLNLLLGWTILGWVGAIVWACTAVRPNTSETPAS